MYECESCHKEFKKRLHLLRHVNTVHVSRKGHKREASDATEVEDPDDSSARSSKMKKTEQTLLGDRWPEQQLMMVTGTIGDILPWSSQQDLMVLAPSIMCAVAIPKGWNSKSACGLWGIDKLQLKLARHSSHHTYDTLQKEMQNVMNSYRTDQG